jgi:hypothetical protein
MESRKLLSKLGERQKLRKLTEEVKKALNIISNTGSSLLLQSAHGSGCESMIYPDPADTFLESEEESENNSWSPDCSESRR